MNGKIGWVDFDGQFVDIEAGSNIRVYHTAAIEEGLHHLMHDHDKNLDSLAIALDAGFQWSNPVFARQSLLDQIGYYLADQILSTAVPLSRMDLELIVTVTSVASKNV